MAKIAVVTGAGTGVGRAVVIELARRDFAVALVGRTEATLNETIKLAGGAKLLPVRCDVGKEADVRAMAAKVREVLGEPAVLVNSAGINVVKRALAEVSADDFRALIDVNLNGAFYCVHEFLPSMRRGGD